MDGTCGNISGIFTLGTQLLCPRKGGVTHGADTVGCKSTCDSPATRKRRVAQLAQSGGLSTKQQLTQRLPFAAPLGCMGKYWRELRCSNTLDPSWLRITMMLKPYGFKFERLGVCGHLSARCFARKMQHNELLPSSTRQWCSLCYYTAAKRGI